MISRSSVRSSLSAFDHHDREQLDLAAEYVTFLSAHDDALWRSCAVGHITASALVIDAISGSVLLTLHPKVGRWLQLGGHLENEDDDLRSGSLREVAEESGIVRGLISSLPVRLDRHPVPCGREADGSARRSVHWDVQYAVQVEGTPRPQISDESDDLRWFAPGELPDIDDSVRALIRDARRAMTGTATAHGGISETAAWVSFG